MSRLPFASLGTETTSTPATSEESIFRTPLSPPPAMLPPPRPAPPRDVVNPSRRLQVGDIINPREPGNDTQYRIRAEIARTHYGRVYVADVLFHNGTLNTREEVILKEFRVDDRNAERLGRTPAAREAALLALVEGEFSASLLIDGRLQRPRSARFNGDWPDKTLYFLLTYDRFTIMPSVGAQRQPIIFLVTNYVPGSSDLREFMRDVLFPMWRAGAVGRYWIVALTIAHKLMQGVAALHTAGIVHRDIKPSNTVVFWDQARGELAVTPYIIDFGHTCAFTDPLRPLVEDRRDIDRSLLRCRVPYPSTRGYLDPAVGAARPNLEEWEKFVLIKNADVYAAAQTIAMMFDTTTTTYEPRTIGQIVRVQPAAPQGMLALLGLMTSARLDERITAADTIVALERIIDHVDQFTTRAAVVAPGAPPPPIVEFELLSDATANASRRN